MVLCLTSSVSSTESRVRLVSYESDSSNCGTVKSYLEKRGITPSTVPQENEPYYEKVKQELQSKFEDAEVVPGTLQYHAFIPTPDRKLQCEKFSSSVESDLFPKEKRSRIAQPEVRKGKPLRESSAKPIIETRRKTAKSSVAKSAPKNRKKPQNKLKTLKRLQGQNIKKKK
ncbi:hypothetical protein QAD02_021481 [Eretmocerus hayati]|uniref:Uncharacterized protein n=1 Tax=Eretmocerus hayati TaxID=131215 RepID=A0ACC2PQE1_9HYME|nr:hypothetical protein QAD02_021481 [Eretmocerus hayati]